MTEREQDDWLRASLQRVDPPDGFADRLIARLPDSSKAGQLPVRGSRWLSTWLTLPRLAWSPAMAAVLAAFVGAGTWEYQQWRDRRIQAERAREELVQALEITSEKVQNAKARLFRPGRGGIL